MTDEEKILKEIEDQIVAGEEKALKIPGLIALSKSRAFILLTIDPHGNHTSHLWLSNLNATEQLGVKHYLTEILGSLVERVLLPEVKPVICPHCGKEDQTHMIPNIIILESPPDDDNENIL